MKKQSLEYQAKNIVMENLIKLTEKYPNKPWKPWKQDMNSRVNFYISSNRNLTMKKIENNLHINRYWTDCDWGYYIYKINSNAFWKFFENNPNEDWKWDIISKNPNLTMEQIENNIDRPWNWKNISKNENLTINMIEKYIDKSWDWDYISENQFKKEYEKELKKLQNFKMIEEELIQKTWHPSRFMDWCLDEDEKEDDDE